MNQTELSLLSQHELHYESSDDRELRKLLGQWKHEIREFVRTRESTGLPVQSALRRIFKSK